MIWKIWVVKSPRCDGFPLCNIFYRRDAARKFAKELRERIGGKWDVLEANIRLSQ